MGRQEGCMEEVQSPCPRALLHFWMGRNRDCLDYTLAQGIQLCIFHALMEKPALMPVLPDFVSCCSELSTRLQRILCISTVWPPVLWRKWWACAWRAGESSEVNKSQGIGPGNRHWLKVGFFPEAHWWKNAFENEVNFWSIPRSLAQHSLTWAGMDRHGWGRARERKSAMKIWDGI